MIIINVIIPECGFGRYEASLNAWEYYEDYDYKWFIKYNPKHRPLYMYNPIKFRKCDSHNNRAMVYLYEKSKTRVDEYGPPYYYYLNIAKVVIYYQEGGYNGNEFTYEIEWYK